MIFEMIAGSMSNKFGRLWPFKPGLTPGITRSKGMIGSFSDRAKKFFSSSGKVLVDSALSSAVKERRKSDAQSKSRATGHE